jgi:hypothetical protein
MRKKYWQITQALIDQSFPLLKGRKIHLMVAKFSFYACSVWVPPILRFIALSKRTVNLSEQAITGLIVHELCHQERYIGMGVRKYLAFAVKFLTSRKARAFEEKATDRLTIEKGYGRALFELSEITHRERKHKSINEFYLSLDEIKSYSESLGKWN